MSRGLERLKELLLTLDPGVTAFGSDGKSETYTVYTPHGDIRELSDDHTEDMQIRVTIDRYTLDPKDDLHRQIVALLEDQHISVDDPVTAYDPDDGSIRHIIDCYVPA